MSFRTDIRHELAQLDTSLPALRKFGLMVGSVFLLLAALGFWKNWHPALYISFSVLGSELLLFGALKPGWLRATHHYWMLLALAMGWCMSRLILTVLFYLAVVPIAFLGRWLRLSFCQIRRHTPQATSYWIDHPQSSAKHHQEMF
jgi:hypothetical protein